MHQLFIGSTGSGKTTALEQQIRQDITTGRGVCVIDPMGALYDRLLKYCCYQKAIGLRLPEIILADFSGGQWTLPYNPFLKTTGDVAVAVDRRVASTLRAWGERDADRLPRLEKWLRCVFWVLIECDLTLLEAMALLDPHQNELRQRLYRKLTNPLIRSKLDQLANYKLSDFLVQTESVENRLMRLWCSGTLRNVMGVGTSALDFAKAMDGGQIVLVNLKPSAYLSREQQRLIGTMMLGEFFERALQRESGSRPFYLYADEAERFVTPELGEALETCRQKGLHFGLSFQHLGQLKTEDIRLYKAIKSNTRNKVVFAVNDREDAQTLADDLFAGLAEPQLKLMRRHLNHLIEDIRQQSTTRTYGQTSGRGTNRSRAFGSSLTNGTSAGSSRAITASEERTSAETNTIGHGTTRDSTTGQSHTTGENETHGWSWAETHSEAQTESTSSANSRSTTSGHFESAGASETLTQSADEEHDLVVVHGKNENHGSNRSTTIGTTETRGFAQTTGFATTHTSQELLGSSRSETTSASHSQGQSQSQSQALSSGRAEGQSRSAGLSEERNSSRGRTQTHGWSDNRERSRSVSRAATNQPGVRHTPFWEEQPEHWTLEEQRWRAAELIMGQPVGHCLLKTATGSLQAIKVPLPRKIYLLPKVEARITEELYLKHNIRSDEVAQVIAKRQAALLPSPPTGRSQPADRAGASAPPVRNEKSDQPIWNRGGNSAVPVPPAEPSAEVRFRPGGLPHKRGPKPDVENHRKVRAIVERFGENWTNDDALAEIARLLDEARVPVPKKWAWRRDGKSRSWQRALEHYRELVVKAIKDRLKAAERDDN